MTDDHVEETTSIEKRRASEHVPSTMPASLQGLSQAEIDKIGRSTTFKMDIIVIPCLIVMYILNYLDRQNIASARLAGLTEDLSLSTTQYQTCVSILFVGYSKRSCPYSLSHANLSSSHAGSIQYDSRSYQISWCIYQFGHGSVGCRLRVHGCR